MSCFILGFTVIFNFWIYLVGKRAYFGIYCVFMWISLWFSAWILRESVVTIFRSYFKWMWLNIMCWNIIVPNLEYIINCSGIHVRVWNAYLRSDGQLKNVRGRDSSEMPINNSVKKTTIRRREILSSDDSTITVVIVFRKLCIALFAVDEGWLLLDIGWFVLFWYLCMQIMKSTKASQMVYYLIHLSWILWKDISL